VYQLTCPQCSHVTTSPFVRVDAVVRCEGCGTIHQIKSEHFRRVLSNALVGDSGAELAPPAPDESDPDDLMEASEVASLADAAAQSGLAAHAAQVEEAQPAMFGDDPPTPLPTARRSLDGVQSTPMPPPVQPPTVAPPRKRPPPSKKLARKMAQNRQLVALLWLSTLGAVALVAVVALVIVMRSNDDDPNTGGIEIVASNGGDPKDATNGDSLRWLSPPRQVIGEWSRHNDPYLLDTSTPNLTVVRLNTESVEDGVLIDATVALRQGAMVRKGVVEFQLVDRNEFVYARSRVPVALLDTRQPRDIQVLVPSRLADALAFVDWRSQIIGDVIAQPLPLPPLEATATTHDGKHALQIRGANGDEALSGVTIVARALGPNDHVYALWLFEVRQAMSPNQTFAFALTAEREPDWDIRDWSGDAVGEPAAGQP